MKNAVFVLVLFPLWIIKPFAGKHEYGGQRSVIQTANPDSMHDLEMILVEGGSYTMGLSSDAGGKGFGKTTRTHPVTVSSFKIAKYEVTQTEWKRVMGDSLNFSLHEDCGKCPVEEVSWNDVQLFIRKLNAITGRHYQLPTEAQWEFAARGGNKSKGYKYAGSDFIDEVVSSRSQFAFKGTSLTVGDSRPNELGIYNMSGNVSEWCQDWFNPDEIPAAQTNPQGPSSGFGHVIRGGSWGFNPSACEVTSFRMGYPNDRDAHVGFRLVLMS